MSKASRKLQQEIDNAPDLSYKGPITRAEFMAQSRQIAKIKNYWEREEARLILSMLYVEPSLNEAEVVAYARERVARDRRISDVLAARSANQQRSSSGYGSVLLTILSLGQG